MCLLCRYAFAIDTAFQDSLLSQLTRSTDSNFRASVLLNLADIYYQFPQERGYLKQLVIEAKKADNTEMLLDGLGNLACSYIEDGKTDSAQYCMDEIRRMDGSPATACWQTLLRMRMFDSKIKKGIESSVEAIDQELKEIINKNRKTKNIYEEIGDAYIIASGYEAQDKYKEALPFAITALNQAVSLPFEEGMPTRMYIMRILKLLYIQNEKFDEVTPLVEKYIALHESHYQQFLKRKRPYYPIESSRIADYTTLIINIRHLSPQKVNFYLQSIKELSEKTKRVRDKYNCFLAINNYHLFKKDYPNALMSNDSLIKYAKVLAPYNVPALYNINSRIYEAMERYKDALHALQTSHTLQDSLTTVKSLEQLNKLQVQFDLNKLNYENSQLEIRNKRIMLISLFVVLFISILISTYLYRNLKKEKAMKAKLRLLKVKAEESEKMKTVFINSICHEIRTPLNAIVGFSDLLFDVSIDEEIRETFPEEIQKNTNLLTGLISSMLEVSNLDVSDEKLPCELTDIGSICHHEMSRIRMTGKPELNFHLNIPEAPLMVATNAQYLALVIENLLNNANKFTESGDITLEYHIDKIENRLKISVTDTGCGIPAEKYEQVFDRFTKLDSFVPGNGLGLYLCRLIVKRLSGTIGFDREYVQGTRVVVSLPMQ